MVLSLAVTIFQSSRSMGLKCISLVWPLLKIYAPINSLSPAEIMPPAYFSFWFSRRPYDKISWDTLRCFSIDRLCSETQLEMSHEFQIFWLHAYITKSLSDAREFLWFFFCSSAVSLQPWQMLAQHLALLIRFKMYPNSFTCLHTNLKHFIK